MVGGGGVGVGVYLYLGRVESCCVVSRMVGRKWQ